MWHRPLIRYMGFLSGGLNFFNSALILMVIVLAKNVGASETQIGQAFSIGGVGGVVGALFGPRIYKRFTFGQAYTVSLCVMVLLFPL